MKKLMESALQMKLILIPFTQCENPSGCISCDGSPHALAAGTTQQHLEATGANWLSAALRHTLRVTSQLSQQQYQHEHQSLLFEEEIRFRMYFFIYIQLL
ncbi:hypothetical protein ATANTOWER_018440 [Ataeniobius toweri]|uniref:Uncharacterized protein n=1 Tax=Ataeniobius toweri TaxID=208326 RepID=A0ABU7BR95_9TELE|nr:hypothetical protein [Ataeniobius toweri]